MTGDHNLDNMYSCMQREYFSLGREESGLERFKKVAAKGHKEAMYVRAIILLCRADQQPELELLCGGKRFRELMSGQVRRECRRRVGRVVRSLWINNIIDQPPRSQLLLCSRHGQPACSSSTRRKGWPREGNSEEEEEEDGWCEACAWNSEVVSFLNMLRGR